MKKNYDMPIIEPLEVFLTDIILTSGINYSEDASLDVNNGFDW